MIKEKIRKKREGNKSNKVLITQFKNLAKSEILKKM
jgi:hypothetical protein